MATRKGFVIPAGGGQHLPMGAPDREAWLKLLADQTGGSIMLFEQVLPAGTKSVHHVHRGSDEVIWVLDGEMTIKVGDQVNRGGPGTCAFLPRDVAHAWKASGTTPTRALFLYTPAAAGRYIEEMVEHVGREPIGDAERQAMWARHKWEVVGPNPL